METIITILATGTLNIVCFFIGAKVGQTVKNGEPIKTPELNPMKAYREMQDRREADREKQKVDVILENIDNYDGTSNGQKDVPWG
jgi:hypothetical protein